MGQANKDDTMLRVDRVFTLAVCLMCLMPASAGAQVSDSCKPVLADRRLTVIVPNAAGGGYDTYARALAPVIDDLTGLRSTIVNMPAAGGLVAMTTLASSDPGELVMIVENGTDVMRSRVEDGAKPWLERLQGIAVFHAEPSAWVGKRDMTIVGAKSLVAASSSSDAAVEFDIISRSLGIEVKVISGYDGSKETEAAVLRGDADLMSGSLSTTLRATKSGELSIKLLLSDKPNDRAPGVPHIAGEDGLVAASATDLAPNERAKRIELARLAVDLSYDVRTVFINRSLREDLRDCFVEAVNAAIRQPEFAKAAEAQSRPVTPMDPAEAEAMLASQITSMAKFKAIIGAP